MLPYFRSAGCHNYSRYAAFYVHHMKGLDPVMMKKLQYGAFVRYIPGIYNSTCTDMFIESTYLRLGHGPNGALGVVTHPDGALMNMSQVKSRTVVSVQIMPSAMDIGQWKTSRVNGRIRSTTISAS